MQITALPSKSSLDYFCCVDVLCLKWLSEMQMGLFSGPERRWRHQSHKTQIGDSMMAPRTLLLSSAVRNLQGKGPCSWSRCLSAASTSAASNDPQQRVETKIDENGIASVELARPEKLNGLDLEMFEALGATAASLRSDKSLRGVILSGQGRGFCAGAYNEAKVAHVSVTVLISSVFT